MNEDELIRWIIKLIEHKNIKAFYNSTYWEKVRAEALDRDNNECQKCKAKGLYKAAECVHHIKHVKQRPELALNLDNLTSLCSSCHDEEHPEKLKRVSKPQLNIERW